jgi:hypothetical protein
MTIEQSAFEVTQPKKPSSAGSWRDTAELVIHCLCQKIKAAAENSCLKNTTLE